MLTVAPSRAQVTVGVGLPVAPQDSASRVPCSHVRLLGQELASISGMSLGGKREGLGWGHLVGLEGRVGMGWDWDGDGNGDRMGWR